MDTESPRPSTQRRERYGMSCLTCRRRKVRCDGTKPVCSSCSRADEQCMYYTHDPSAARLSVRLERSEARVVELERELRSASGKHHQNPVMRPSREPMTCIESADGSLDVNGEYYGATSRFHVGRSVETGSLDESGSLGKSANNSLNIDYHRRWLASNSRFQQRWERSAYENLSNIDGIEPEEAAILLNIYWTWQAPLHNCVYRKTFARDMALGGPYFSQFLLTVIFAHACRHAQADDLRFIHFEKGEFFLRRAKTLLVDELGREKPRIPTIQGLLILGGRQSAIGQNSEGWLYTGMAIRMIKDLGMHVARDHEEMLNKIEPDDLEARKRLYLSAYTWDKSISLILGRSPALTEMPFPAKCLLDDFDDQQEWRPTYFPELETQYPSTLGYITSTFSNFVEHAKIVNDIYGTIYNANLSAVDQTMIFGLEEKLRHFYQDLPPKLRIEDIQSLSHCPPPHIFTLNIVCHTALILLYRPFFRSPQLWAHRRENERGEQDQLVIRANKVCLTEAAKVNDFFQAHGRTFWFRNQTYLTSYCVYTAATIDVMQLQHAVVTEERGEATQRLETTLRMLEAEAVQTPGIRRSVDITRTQLDNVMKVPSDTGQMGHRPKHRGTQSNAITTDPWRASGSFSADPIPDLESTFTGTHFTMPIDIDWYLDASGGFVPAISPELTF